MKKEKYEIQVNLSRILHISEHLPSSYPNLLSNQAFNQTLTLSLSLIENWQSFPFKKARESPHNPTPKVYFL